MRPRASIAVSLALAFAASCGEDAYDVAALSGAPIEGAPIDAPVKPPERAPEPPELAEVEPEPSATPDADPPPAIPPPGGHGSGHGVTSAPPAENLQEGTSFITFEDVAFPEYEPPELREVEDEVLELSEFPEAVLKLNGTEVAMDGYMVPVDFEDRKVTSFILSRYLPGCCFGVMPMMDEWIEVEVLEEEGVDYFPFQIVRVTGEFEVGEVLDDYGYVRSIYRIQAEKVEEQQ